MIYLKGLAVRVTIVTAFVAALVLFGAVVMPFFLFFGGIILFAPICMLVPGSVLGCESVVALLVTSVFGAIGIHMIYGTLSPQPKTWGGYLKNVFECFIIVFLIYAGFSYYKYQILHQYLERQMPTFLVSKPVLLSSGEFDKEIARFRKQLYGLDKELIPSRSNQDSANTNYDEKLTLYEARYAAAPADEKEILKKDLQSAKEELALVNRAVDKEIQEITAGKLYLVEMRKYQRQQEDIAEIKQNLDESYWSFLAQPWRSLH